MDHRDEEPTDKDLESPLPINEAVVDQPDEEHGNKEEMNGVVPTMNDSDNNKRGGDDDDDTKTAPLAIESRASDDTVTRGSLSFDEKESTREEKKEFKRSFLLAFIEGVKYFYSMLLLFFSVMVVMAAIFTEQTVGTAERGIPPVVACVVFWFLIVWLAMMEGGQGCLVGLQPIDKSLYAKSHPRTLKNTEMAHKGNNMERFIIGRQFLVVLVVFVTNMMAAAVTDADVLVLGPGLKSIFLSSGVAVILVTIILGQLTAQVNAANCILDFVNNYFMLYFVTYVSLVIEFSGLLHSVYLIQIVFAMITGKPVASNEPPRNLLQNIFFWARVMFSVCLLGFAFAVTLSALFDGQTTMWDGIPPYVSIILFFVLMAFAGLMDGMQIALFAVVNLPEEELKKSPVAYANCQLTFSGQNLQAFLIGRQICVTCCTFVVARVTTLDVQIGQDGNIFGVSNGIQEFFNTGLLGAVITTIFASLAWRIIASTFPVAFLSNPLINLVIRLCLLLEVSGICSASWVLAAIHKRVVGYQVDEVYLGTPEERDAKMKELEDLALEEGGGGGDDDDVDKQIKATSN